MTRARIEEPGQPGPVGGVPLAVGAPGRRDARPQRPLGLGVTLTL